MAEPITIELRKPIRFGVGMVTSLTFRPCKAKDLRKLQSDKPMQMIIDLAGYLSGQPKEVIDELEGDDLAEAIKIVSGFIPGSPATGSEPSPS